MWCSQSNLRFCRMNIKTEVSSIISNQIFSRIFQGSINSYRRPANARTADSHLHDRQERVAVAKAGVRRRRGPRMQVSPRKIDSFLLLVTRGLLFRRFRRILGHVWISLHTITNSLVLQCTSNADLWAQRSFPCTGICNLTNILTQPCRTLPRPTTPISLLESLYWVVTNTPAAAEVYTDISGNIISEHGDAENSSEDDHGQRHRGLGKRDSSKEFYTRVLSER